MDIKNRLASSLDDRSDVPNQILAKELIEANDAGSVKAIVELMIRDTDKNIQSDCIKTLYEIGYLKPRLISPYATEFLKVLSSKNNRLVWGGMIALSCIASLQPDEIWKAVDQVISTIDQGSVITHDAGVRVLAALAASNAEYSQKLFPILLRHLKEGRVKDIPKDAESIFPAVNTNNTGAFIEVLEERKKEMSPSQSKRIKNLLKKL
ncbi:MAG: hypothetical protein JXA19_01745 [Anaerolineales bacterium]|nr:hypothetical protein [Anaerolineales bacterium]